MKSEHETQMMEQLAAVLRRLDSYPFSDHQSQILRDCLRIAIRTFVGEALTAQDMQKVGGFEPPPAETEHVETFGFGQMLRGGVEVAPGVVEYAPQNQASGQIQDPTANLDGPALIDVAASKPKPVAGSLMALAQSGGEIAPPQVEATQAPATTPSGIPAPHETKVEIVSQSPASPGSNGSQG